MAQSYINLTAIKFSNRDLQEYLKMCSSIDKYGNVHPRCILTPSGNPIPADEYQKAIGARKLKDKFDFSKSDSDRRTLELHKQSYKTGMRALFGSDWKKTSRKLKYNNVPSEKWLRDEIVQEVTNLNS